MTKQERAEQNAFLGGLLTAVWMLTAPCDGAREQLLGELDCKTGWQLIRFAKRNGEYRSSGLSAAARYVPPYNRDLRG